ncbi:MAG: MogA/MoaB family molybdenum cofactor biosynthesis protein [bacterium]
MNEFAYKAGVLTVSDQGAKGAREDRSGDAAALLLEDAGFRVEKREVCPDSKERIKQTLSAWCDLDKLDLVVTTGGTGFARRDLTPEATSEVIHRFAPGISEAMRQKGLENTPRAMLSRGVSGIRYQSLIINLPGSEKGVRESLQAVLPALAHGLEILTGRGGECG